MERCSPRLRERSGGVKKKNNKRETCWVKQCEGKKLAKSKCDEQRGKMLKTENKYCVSGAYRCTRAA